MKEATKQPPTRRGKRAPRLTVTVPAEIIATATRKDSEHCMIADAIKAAIPSAKKVSVDLQTIRWSDPQKRMRYTYLTPRVAQAALVDFDRGKKPEPFQIRLRGAHVTSMHQTGTTKLAHKLGRRKISTTKTDDRKGLIPETVGGKPLPSRKGKRREFGMRGFTLSDLI